MKFNWDQTGMPASLVSRLGQRNEFSEFKTVLNDAQNQVLQPVDAESMARELVENGGREYVEMVRELTASLENTKKELEEANRRYEWLVADLGRRGIPLEDPEARQQNGRQEDKPQRMPPAIDPEALMDGLAEWEEWDRRFKALLG